MKEQHKPTTLKPQETMSQSKAYKQANENQDDDNELSQQKRTTREQTQSYRPKHKHKAGPEARAGDDGGVIDLQPNGGLDRHARLLGLLAVGRAHDERAVVDVGPRGSSGPAKKRVGVRKSLYCCGETRGQKAPAKSRLRQKKTRKRVSIVPREPVDAQVGRPGRSSGLAHLQEQQSVKERHRRQRKGS